MEEAIIARVTIKCTANTPASLSQRPSLSNCGLSAGQQAVVKAALSILVNKAVLLGCPLRRHGAWAPQDGEGSFTASGSCFSRAKNNTITTRFCCLSPAEMDKYLLEFRGGTFPLSGISSYKGSGSGGGRRGRDSSKLRRSNTSPRKKGSTLKWSCGGSFREGRMVAVTALARWDLREVRDSPKRCHPPLN